MNLLIAIPNVGDIRTELVEFLFKADKIEGIDIEFFGGGGPVDLKRNKMVNYFLNETDKDWIMMIDDDIIPPDNIFEMLEEHSDKYIISPLIFGMKEGIPYPVASELNETPDGKKLRMSTGSFEEVLSVDAVGTGCLFVRREVFKNMKHPIFRFTHSEGEEQGGELKEGEDLMFCLKARELGYEIHMITTYICGHMQICDFSHIMRLLHLAIKTDESKVFFTPTKTNQGDSDG